MVSGETAASAIAARTARAQAFQMSDDDCSTISPASCQVLIGYRAKPSSLPAASNTPARVLDFPTSTPIKACGIYALRSSMTGKPPAERGGCPFPARVMLAQMRDQSLPACVSAIDQHDAAGHQARGLRCQKQHD